MTQRAPLRSRQSYRHEAFLWRDPADFTATMVSFIEEGLESASLSWWRSPSSTRDGCAMP